MSTISELQELLKLARDAEESKMRELNEKDARIEQLVNRCSEPQASTSISSRKFNSNVRAPDSLNVTTGDISENFKMFKAMFYFYSTAANLEYEPRDVQVANLLSAMGKEAFRLYFAAEKAEATGSETVKGIFAVLEKVLKLEQSLIFNRYAFHKCDQETGESFAEYCVKLNKLLSVCGYKDCATLVDVEKEILRD